MKTEEEILKQCLVGFKPDNARAITEEDWEEGKLDSFAAINCPICNGLGCGFCNGSGKVYFIGNIGYAEMLYKAEIYKSQLT